MIVVLEGKIKHAHDGPMVLRNHTSFCSWESNCKDRLAVLRAQLKAGSGKRPRHDRVKTSFYDGKQWSKRRRLNRVEREELWTDDLDTPWQRSMPRYCVVLERCYRYLSLRRMLGDELTLGESRLLSGSSEFVEDEDREEGDGAGNNSLVRSAWSNWLLSPRGPYSLEVRDLIEQGGDNTLGFLARKYGASTVRVADFIHRNREYGCVNCVCHWPGCPYLVHTLGSVAQKSCRILCENAGKYRLVATRAPDCPAIREWLGTPSGAVIRMLRRSRARARRVRRDGGVDTNRDDVRAVYRENEASSDVVEGGAGIWSFAGDQSWLYLDVESNSGWRKVLYRRAAEAEMDAADQAEEAEAAEALESALLASNTFNV